MTKLETSRKWAVRAAFALAVMYPLFMMIAPLGAKAGLWDWRTGFGLIRGFGKLSIGEKLMYLTLIVSIISLFLSVAVRPRLKKAIIISALAMMVPLAAMAYGAKMKKLGKSVPPIHDISTDTQSPPTFTSAIISARGDKSNTLEYLGKKVARSKNLVAAAQTKAYPDIRTLVLTETPEITFEKAKKTVKSLGWKQVSANGSTGVIEATVTTFWFGFKDDVVIRIRPGQGGGSIVDVRSVSRVGMSDLGANAARIRKFLKNMGG